MYSFHSLLHSFVTPVLVGSKRRLLIFMVEVWERSVVIAAFVIPPNVFNHLVGPHGWGFSCPASWSLLRNERLEEFWFITYLFLTHFRVFNVKKVHD